MIRKDLQFFLNRFKLNGFLSALLVLFLPSVVLAQATLLSISVSNTNPTAGSSISVTVTYNETTYEQPEWVVGITPAANSNLVCPSATNEYFLVDGNTPNPGTSPVVSTQQDPTDASAGWVGTATGGTVTNPYTQIFTVTIPAALSNGGSYNIVVQEGEYYVSCNTSNTFIATGITIPLPPTGCTLTSEAQSTSVAPGGLLLYTLNYTFVNTTNFTLTDQVPANTTLYSASPGGTLSGSTVTWTPYTGVAAAPITGTAWMLVSVNTGATSGTVISDSAVGTAVGESGPCTNSASSTVVIPQITPVKSESATSLAAGSPVSYTLYFTATGSNLQYYDTYDNISVGTSDSTGSTVPWGYDTTPYQVFKGPGPGTSLGTWSIDSTDAEGDHFIEATTPYNSTGNGGNYPELIRNDPGAEICNSITVQGDLQIPVTAAGANSGADAHMVIALNASQGITFKGGISIDNSPGNLFIQTNNIYPLQSASAYTNFTTPFAIAKGQWYTMRATVQSNGSGTTTFNIQLWQTGNPGSVVTLNYTDTSAPQPTCSGGWRSGWQADETAGTDWYSNLQVYGPGPFINAAVTDVVPQNITYGGSNLTDTVSGANPQTLVWNSPSAFPTTIFSFDTPVSWWGTVGCTAAPIINQFTMSANDVSATTSNPVTLSVSGVCSTATNTATSTETATPTPTSPITGSPTPSNTPTATVTVTPTLSSTPITSTTCVTYLWPDPFDPQNGTLKISCMNDQTVVDIYTVSGELVRSLTSSNSICTVSNTDGTTYCWDGRNSLGLPVASGIYYYVIEKNNQVTQRGKFLVVN